MGPGAVLPAKIPRSRTADMSPMGDDDWRPIAADELEVGFERKDRQGLGPPQTIERRHTLGAADFRLRERGGVVSHNEIWCRRLRRKDFRVKNGQNCFSVNFRHDFARAPHDSAFKSRIFILASRSPLGRPWGALRRSCNGALCKIVPLCLKPKAFEVFWRFGFSHQQCQHVNRGQSIQICGPIAAATHGAQPIVPSLPLSALLCAYLCAQVPYRQAGPVSVAPLPGADWVHNLGPDAQRKSQDVPHTPRHLAAHCLEPCSISGLVTLLF